ncbi:hypothetical protein HI914_03637 [Erysiphe necator]|nr:hypothetical protein HI914_03637 [Erysiphe necator]
MKSQGSVVQKILAKDDATESDLETIMDILIEEYPANDEDDKSSDPHNGSLREYMGRAKTILKGMGAKDTTAQSKAICFFLQISIKSFIKGLYNHKLAERLIEEERKIHLGTLAEARITILEFYEHMKMITRMKEQKILASKAAALDAGEKRSGRTVNLAEINWENYGYYNNKNKFQSRQT